MSTTAKHRIPGSITAIAIAMSLATTGCTSWIAKQIVTPPGADNTNYVVSRESREQFADAYGFRRVDIRVGPPEATLAVTLIEPADYGLTYRFHEYRRNTVEVDIDLNDPEEVGAARGPVRGTVVILPGMLQSRYTMTFWGIGLAQRGYRVALVDLRGHGESTGQHLTYGIIESRDTIQVVEALREAGAANPPVILLGASYGASTALMAAAESEAIDAVVAFAPFTDAASSIEHLARTMFPLLSRTISRERMAEAIDRASAICGEDLRRARAIDMIERIDVPVLFVHGHDDDWVPARNSLELFQAANGAAGLLVIPGAGHMDLPMRYDEFSERVFDWLDKVLRVPNPTSTRASLDSAE